MIKSNHFLLGTLFLLVVAIAILGWDRLSSGSKGESGGRLEGQESSIPSGMQNQALARKEGLAPLSYLPKHDPKRVKKIVEEINAAMASGDRGAVRRAFHATAYSRAFKNSEVQEAFKLFLDDSNAQVRLLASQYLYLTGDNSGRTALIGIMQSPSPLGSDGVDPRLVAAQILSKYREQSALPNLIDFYEKNQSPSLLYGILRMSQGRVPDSIHMDQSQSNNPYGLFVLSLLNPQLAMEKAPHAFNSPNVPQVYKASTINTAAWVMASNGHADAYLAHLIEHSKKAINREIPTGYDTGVYREALKYLGSIDDPRAREVLEVGLKSKSAEVVQYSAINLLFNQSGGYKPVKELILSELDPGNVKNFKLGEELKWHLIAAMANDAEIVRAAQNYSRQTGLSDWEYNVVERKSWPIYNWVDDYVVRLNRSAPMP